MKKSVDSLDIQELEILWNQAAQQLTKKPSILSALNKLLCQIVDFFLGGNELRIWRTNDHGSSWWHAYDPVTGRSTSAHSEAEMRAWIEQRYYQ